jgi:chromosome segregation ATPase
MASSLDTRIDALRSGGNFNFPGGAEQETKRLRPSHPKQQQQTDLTEKYAHLKAQLATLDRTLRTELEAHEETQAQLVRVTQEKDLLKSENGRLRAKVDELYLAITKLSAGAAQDRQEAVAAALASASVTSRSASMTLGSGTQEKGTQQKRGNTN